MPVVGSAKTSKETELLRLRRGIAVERRARYADFQGKRSTFSQFMRQTADRLCKSYPADAIWSTIRALFRQYPHSDVATRIALVRRAEELLVPFWQELESGLRAQQQALEQADGVAPAAAACEPAAPPALAPSKGAAVVKDSAPPAPKAVPAKADPGQTSVQFVKGVGPKGAQTLSKLGIQTVEDLVRHYPRKHLDFQNRLFIRQLQAHQEVTVFGAIRSVGAFQSRNRNVSILTISINDGTGSLAITRFIGGRSNKYLLDRYKEQFPKGAQVLASGLVERDRFSGKLTLKNAEIEILGFVSDEDDSDNQSTSTIHAGRLVPVYPLTEGIGLRHLRNIIHNALQAFTAEMTEPLPEQMREELGLCGLAEALNGIHFPQSLEDYEKARRRLVFDELFAIQVQLAQRRYQFDSSEGALSLDIAEDGLSNKLLEVLPFQLTGAQKRVFGEIRRDLASAKPMHRLVQGDVGSGKTVVALLAFMVAIENHYQGVMMAPTEILAEQHFRQFQRLITPLGLRCALFVGKQGQRERRELRQLLSSGQVHIAVGTHALLEEDVEFKNLGLIVIDEQHRFGVKQRARLKAKSQSPELLTMTATPIPRTLALTMHGDLDVSEIDELPPGRKPVKTKIMRPTQKKQLQAEIRLQLMAGRQVYIVLPLIEESETLSAKAATPEYERLQEERDFSGYSIGLMHGKLHPTEKDEIMEKFRCGQFQILVCTTVIEVGVDVPNATVMVIENADRFGLAQLHQLRGRVGRGADQSYCYLVADAKAETTRQRLEIMEQTNDGFVIAQKDLELRGPGEFMGYRQSGLPDLVLADLVKDARTLEEARNAAIALVKADPQLAAHEALRACLSKKLKVVETEVMRSG